MRLVIPLVCALAVAGSYSKQKKKKVGTDIKIKDTYHPWDTDRDDLELDPHDLIGEYMLENLHKGECLDTAISKLEAFSASKHLGMTLGDEKGSIIEQAIAESIKPGNDIAFIEFGSHIGDLTLRLIRQLSKLSTGRCLIFALEANQQWLGIGHSLVRHAMKMADENSCQYVPFALKEDITEIINVIKSGFNVETVAGVFLDHKHANFLRDINIMHEKGILKEGTLVIADNALRHKKVMDQFIAVMKKRGRNLRLADVSDPYPDQVLIAEWIPPKPRSKKHDSAEL